jgi:hypothetical protein
MSDDLFIPKGRVLPASQDYQLLRSAGLSHIESLASELWTDYNSHDPGITIMEALCYAITELGYRAGFDIKDLLADTKGNVEVDQAFFTARDILTCEPVCVEDYRKLLVDTVGVHNAWMIPRMNVNKPDVGEIPKAEVTLYPDCKNDRLVYKESDHHDPIDIRGLYKVLLDLDFTNEFGDLNSGNITYTFTETELLGVQLEVMLPRWREADFVKLNKIYNKPIQAVQVVKPPTKDYWEIELTYLIAGETIKFSYRVLIALRKRITNLEAEVESDLKQKIHHQEIMSMYYEKLQLVMSIIEEIQTKIHAHRNLCEDYLQIDTVKAVFIGFCADIEVRPDIDIEGVLAQVYFQIEEYFNPDVKFYSLREMLDKKKPVEDIFEGPKLDHGFIDTEELKATNLRSHIYVSDIVNFMMDIEGVLAVRNVMLTKYNANGEAIMPSDRWCVDLAEGFKPVLDINRSKILFFKDRLPFIPNKEETLDTLRLLRGINEKGKLKGHENDLEIPQGTHYDLDDYLTVQYEFPQTYGIDPDGLSEKVSTERKARVRQLKAYMMFYDQLLAGYFSQLSNAKHLLSLRKDLVDTYFQQFITDIKGIDKIYRTVTDPEFTQVVPLQEALESPVLPALNDAQRAANRQHYQLVETREQFYERRNRFLDHLLARFSESFNEYVLMLYSSQGTKVKSEKLVQDKITFIEDYPVISSERGRAFNYIKPSWNTQNVSGLEKRVSRLTGIEDFSRRNLFCYAKIIITDLSVPNNPKFVFSLQEPAPVKVAPIKPKPVKPGVTPVKPKEVVAPKDLLVNLKLHTTYEEAEAYVNEVYDNMLTYSRYRKIEETPGKINVVLYDENGSAIAQSAGTFLKDATAEAFIQKIITTFKTTCNPEGMHLVEHLLLRPRFNPPTFLGTEPEDVYKLMQVCLADDCKFCGEEDPYSFRISVLLPFWPARFRDMNFRRFFEKTLRTEAPAHVSLKICWLNYTSMCTFEEIYKEWLEALDAWGSDIFRNDKLKKNRLREASNKMVSFLATVHSEYPEARLHDCDTGVTNPVMLGNTVLGTF